MRKLGPHIQRSSPSAAEWARKAWIVKSMDDVDMLRLARPGAITIYRRYYEHQDTSRNGAEVAAEIVEKLHGFVPTFIELYNEHEAYLQTGLENHVRFTREATDYLHARGCKVLGFSFNVGGPEMQDWVYLRQQRYAGVDAIGLHEYWANQGFTQWRALRHRLVHQWTEGDHPPFVISECGRDAIVEEGATGRGWRAQGVMDEQYAEELEQYDAELCKDDYVIGGTVFTAGPYDGWLDFSTDGLSERFSYGDTPLSVWTPQPAPVPTPTPEPPPTPESKSIALAVFPALQAYNRYVKYTSDEWSATRWQADRLVEQARAKGINVKAFHRQSDIPSSTAQLQVQQDEGYDWLMAQPETVKIGLNLHTDSGTISHTYGIYTTRWDARSHSLADALSIAVQRVLTTQSRAVFAKLGTIDYNTYLFSTRSKEGSIPVLLELCSHQSERDLDALWAAGAGLSAALVDALIAWVSGTPDVADVQTQLDNALAKLSAIRTIVGVT